MMMQVMVLVAAGLLAGCASGAKVDQMVVTPGTVAAAAPSSPMHQAVSIGKVAGGQDTNPMWTSQVDNGAFSEALSQTLVAHRMLGKPADSRYVLEAELKSLEQPLFGFNLEVISKVGYKLRDKTSGAAILDEEVKATGTAGVNDAFVAVERLRISNERSVKNNIQEFMQRLNGVKPSGVPTS